MKGWQRELIDPVEALIAPRKNVWKEKYGTLRVEWIRNEDGSLTDADGIYKLIEEASRRCCADCGRWHGWLCHEDHEAAVVTNQPVHGWYLTLCQWCRRALDAENGDA